MNMGYLRHVDTPGADAPVQPVQAQMAAPFARAAQAVSPVQDHFLGQAARAQDHSHPAGSQARLSPGGWGLS
jgi:hypothetical protein